MRIENTSRPSHTRSTSSTPQRGSGGAFSIEGSAGQRAATAIGGNPAIGGIESLLALQSVDDPLLRRRRTVKRGTALLDTLEDLKADLLIGRLSEGRINQLLALLGQARDRGEPEVEALIDEIELRARVELAKLGR
ncbi:flagellar assembly regulator FliX [Arsenicitalea aurantiaca]|uniref:Flagellar assembly regulator FliX n=1 Tax=Arsenicitalea aurantiaca TaxID=1783274 RepID=A0A433XGG6_9HYPH|nr:flagellar assembly protein FliX [Arsenicitalea aurantiaca]RUT33132.1 flagellar assembly regulator FliX [Arsenicitalea aurantiaca]